MAVFSLLDISHQNRYFASSYMYARWFFSEIIYLMHNVDKKELCSPNACSYHCCQFKQQVFVHRTNRNTLEWSSWSQITICGMFAHPHQTWHFVWGFMGVFGAHWKARAKSPELDTTPIVLERKTRCLINGSTQRTGYFYINAIYHKIFL